MVKDLRMRFIQSIASAVVLVKFVTGQECTADGRCDTHERCRVWGEEGECVRALDYMRKHCPATCHRIRLEEGPAPQECVDRHQHCKHWADLGECDSNIANMMKYCPFSCGKCNDEKDDDAPEPSEACQNMHENCDFWASLGECEKNPNYMLPNCAKACKSCAKTGRTLSAVDEELVAQTKNFGTLQTVEGQKFEATLKTIRQSIQYMNSKETQNLSADILESCQNRNNLCAFWAALGECEKNKAYMQTNCAPSCKSCHLIDIRQRCPKIELDPALHPGDLNKMFERIVRQAPGNRTDQLTREQIQELEAERIPMYTVVVHSRPGDAPATEISAALDKSLPPWVVTLENFLTDEECDALIQLGYKYEYKRSEDVGELRFDGTHGSVKSEKRTSENAWCSTHQGCREEEVPKRIHNRMAKVMGIPPENSEDLQILKYEKGQFYRTHHDFIPHQVDRQCGPRILTFFLYLSDVEKGGGTNFPQLDLTIEPKKGRALLWPSVYDSNPMVSDQRMYHQALEVIEGVKFAANGWIHQYNYVAAQEAGCT